MSIRNLRPTPYWLFLLIWIASIAIIAASATVNASGLIYNLGIGVFAILTIAITQTAPAERADSAQRPRLYAQIAFILLIIVITGLGGMVFHNMIDDVYIPVWSDINRAIGSISFDLLGSSTFLSNPWRYFVVPFIVLLLMRARPPELGFGRGHRVWRVVALWCIIPLAAILFAGFAGLVSFERVGRLFFANALNNGFFEEFLFRGALQTRLRRLMSPAWSIVITGLVFGVWHLGLGYANYGSVGLPAVIASTILFQGFLGVIFGIIFERTRNLIAPSIVHVVLNVFGSL